MTDEEFVAVCEEGAEIATEVANDTLNALLHKLAGRKDIWRKGVAAHVFLCMIVESAIQHNIPDHEKSLLDSYRAAMKPIFEKQFEIHKAGVTAYADVPTPIKDPKDGNLPN